MSITEWLNAHGGFFLGVAAAAAFWFLARERRTPEIVSETAHGRIRLLWLMEEDPLHRLLLRKVLDIIEGDGEDDPAETAPQEVLARLAWLAFESGDSRAGMFEAFTAAANHGEHATAIEARVWEVLERDRDETAYRCERITRRDLR